MAWRRPGCSVRFPRRHRRVCAVVHCQISSHGVFSAANACPRFAASAGSAGLPKANRARPQAFACGAAPRIPKHGAFHAKPTCPPTPLTPARVGCRARHLPITGSGYLEPFFNGSTPPFGLMLPGLGTALCFSTQANLSWTASESNIGGNYIGLARQGVTMIGGIACHYKASVIDVTDDQALLQISERPQSGIALLQEPIGHGGTLGLKPDSGDFLKWIRSEYSGISLTFPPKSLIRPEFRRHSRPSLRIAPFKLYRGQVTS